MRNSTVRNSKQERYNESAVPLFLSLLAVAAAAMLALIFCLMANLRGVELLAVVVASSLVVGGIVFSLLELYGQGRGDKALKQISAIAAFEAQLALERARAERDNVESSISLEPYRHHEDHAESPGRDQGQLTSNLPGTTPFFEKASRLRMALTPKRPLR